MQVARVLGFGRTGARITEALDAIVQELLDRGDLLESFGLIVTARQPASREHPDRHEEGIAEVVSAPPEKESTGEYRSVVIDQVARRLDSQGHEVIDRRPSGGNLWIVGGSELDSLFEDLAVQEIRFAFARKGSRTTGGRPAWWIG